MPYVMRLRRCWAARIGLLGRRVHSAAERIRRRCCDALLATLAYGRYVNDMAFGCGKAELNLTDFTITNRPANAFTARPSTHHWLASAGHAWGLISACRPPSAHAWHTGPVALTHFTDANSRAHRPG